MVTVRCTGSEAIPWSLAVRVTLPPFFAMPVTMALFLPSLLRAFTAATVGSELTHVNASPVIAVLNWSNPVTVNDTAFPACTIAVSGATVIIVKTASGLVVVSVVLLLTPCAEEAVMMVVPALGPPAPVANPVELMVAVFKSLLVNVKATPFIGFPYWSKPAAANC